MYEDALKIIAVDCRRVGFKTERVPTLLKGPEALDPRVKPLYTSSGDRDKSKRYTNLNPDSVTKTNSELTTLINL